MAKVLIGNIKGTKGDAGPEGPQGIQGEQGPVGPQGPQGDVGPQGPQGETGPQGDQGESGNKIYAGTNMEDFEIKTGDIFIDTETGDVSEIGERVQTSIMPPSYTYTTIDKGNIKGPQGDVGPQGPQGPKGDTSYQAQTLRNDFVNITKNNITANGAYGDISIGSFGIEIENDINYTTINIDSYGEIKIISSSSVYDREVVISSNEISIKDNKYDRYVTINNSNIVINDGFGDEFSLMDWVSEVNDKIGL